MYSLHAVTYTSVTTTAICAVENQKSCMLHVENGLLPPSLAAEVLHERNLGKFWF